MDDPDSRKLVKKKKRLSPRLFPFLHSQCALVEASDGSDPGSKVVNSNILLHVAVIKKKDK